MRGKEFLKREAVAVLGLGLVGIIWVGDSTLAVCSPQSTATGTAGTIPGELIPTGRVITPTVAKGAIFQDLNPHHRDAPDVRVGGPLALALSPDGRVLAILSGGFNSFYDSNGHTSPELASEYLFLFDLTGATPRQFQALPIHATFQGLSWTPSSDRLFASGGVDDSVIEFVRTGSGFVAGRTFHLGHRAWVGPNINTWLGSGGENCPGCTGEVSGLAVGSNGRMLLVANFMNDSVSLIDIAGGRVVTEQDLRPGIINPKHHGQPGGSYPRAVVWNSPTHAYVASERDREIISLAIRGDRIHVGRRMPVRGQPVALLANRSGSRLYVALDTTNQVAIVDTAEDKIIESLDVVAPHTIFTNNKMLGGANTNALALTPDEGTLLASNGGENAIAVVRLSDHARGLSPDHRMSANRDDDEEGGPGRAQSRVIALVPTGWYPTGVTTSKDGRSWYIVNGKSPTGPNGGQQLMEANKHIEQLEKAGFLAMPVPTPLELAKLTKQVAMNNHFDRPDKTAADERLFSFLHDHIKHVIYIMKENRSYDQVLGDLEVGNGDRRLTFFPERITPNHHAMARNFVDLDNTLVSGEGSFQGFMWTYAAQTTDYNERNEPLIYAGRGVRDWYGSNREISTGRATSKQRHSDFTLSPADPDILPGVHDVNAPDGPGGEEGKGYIWDAALRQGLTIRNWGLSPHLWMSGWDSPIAPSVGDAYAQNIRVFWPSKAALIPYSDPYYRALYTACPDFWRAKEWKREFAEFTAAKAAPNLMVMWLGNDHFGLFDKAIDGVNTPETQMADNDYALGQIVEAVANSPFANDTLIVSIEDDAWGGSDHVDSHRTIALFAGPYVRQHAVVATRYTTVSVVKTIEDILGIGPTGLNDALAEPMSDVFDPSQESWFYRAIVPDVLRSTKLPLPPDEHAKIAYPRHSAAYWAKAMADQDFSGPDRLNRAFSRELWRGLKGNVPYPATNQLRKTTESDEQ